MNKFSKVCTLFLFVSIGADAQSTEKMLWLNRVSKHTTTSVKNQAAKNQAVYQPDFYVDYSWVSGVNQWYYNDSTFFTYTFSGLVASQTKRNGNPSSQILSNYNAYGNLTERINQNWDAFNNVWNNTNRTVYTYDSQQHITESLGMYWVTVPGTWVNSARTITIFDNHDNQIEQRSEFFNTSTNQWQINNGHKNILTYSSNNRIIDNISQYWDTPNSAWKDDIRETNITYNSIGAMTQHDIQTKIGTSWQNDSREKMTYDLSNKLIEITDQAWSGSTYTNNVRATNITWHSWTGDINTSEASGYLLQDWGTPNLNQWNNSYRISTTYDNFGGSVELDELYANNLWVNDSRYSEFFDAHFNSTGNRNESWLGGTSGWGINNESKMIHSYDGLFNITESIWQYYDFSSQSLINSQKRVYGSYHLYTGLPDLSSPLVSLLVYPNPCSTNCTISMDISQLTHKGDLELKLLDSNGKEVYRRAILSNLTSIERGDLPNGIYFYSIMDKSGVLATGKLLIE